MKKSIKCFTVALALLTALACPAFAQDKGHDHSSHGSVMKDAPSLDKGHQMSDTEKDKMKDHKGHGAEVHKMEGHGTMDHSGHSGVLIHESEVEGYKFAYHLIDMREKMKHMKGMPEMKDTHHLMVYIKSPHGHALDKAKAGYMLKNPDGSDQKKIAMAMGGGFGADINLSAAGEYSIKTKVMDGDKKLIDEFEYEVK